MSRTLSAVLALSILAAAASGLHAVQPQQEYRKVRIEFTSMTEFEEFMKLPDLDVMDAKPGVGVTIVADPEQLAEIESMGYSAVVEIEDMEAYYSSRIRGDNFGEFYTYSETIDFLDDLYSSYPSIVTEKFSIGQSLDGNDIWAIKISDNPGVDETEPEILFDGLHHAREPISIDVQLHFMEWLTSNYGTDPEATYLVDNREMFFVPVINPDGYLYNELMNPTGGGMWRKNRRDVQGSSCYGVDPNRNYDILWSQVGSSSNPCDDTYCGTGPHSEPEIQAYTDFALSRDIRFNLSFHSVVGAILIPWGYTTSEHTPDDALLREIGATMAQYNGYEVGQAGEILWYSCSGTTTDWMYDTVGILAMCIEVGGSDFWPLESEIPGLREENLWPQIYVTRMVGPYLSVSDLTFSGGDGDQDPEPGETLDITLTVMNDGAYDAVDNAKATIHTSDPYIQLVDAESPFGNLAPRATGDNSADPLTFSVDASVPDGHTLSLTMVLEGDGFYAEEEFSWLLGEATVLFSDDMESGTGNWVENDGYWDLSTLNFHTPDNSYTDSPIGNYGNNRNTWIELASPVDLAHASQAQLSFWHRVMTEDGYDFCYVEASPDGGTTWYQLGPRYDGNVNWENVVLDIPTEYCTADFKARFRLQTDTYVVDDGWFVDDVQVLGPPVGNAAPSAPALSGPPDGASVQTMAPELSVVNATDPDGGDALTYAFMVYSDELRTNQVASATGVAEGGGTTEWTVDPPLGDGEYWWTAYADDGTERGPLMETASFTVESSGVEDNAMRLALAPARPNPFRAETRLSFTLPSAGRVDLSVYSVDGRMIRKVVSGRMAAGEQSVTWDGRDESGREVGSGLYFMKLEADSGVRRGKLLLLR
ncbi:MAG: T9SS type A sorting domain-containing protein [Candidatus Eisenbacteria bacterium]|nr:T9SS type A sorting domain-containing protein [Candidatus Eisenbacteria bacterium]